MVEGLGFWVKGWGLRVEGLGLEFRVQGIELSFRLRGLTSDQ